MPTAMIRVALLVLALTAPLRAQPRPSFAGEWVRVDSAPERARVAATGDAAFRVGDMGSGWGSPLTIRQSADSLVVDVTHFSAYDLQPRLRYAFTLGGGETLNRITIGHAESAQRSRVQWNGATLIITTQHPTPPDVAPAPTEVRQTLSLDESGRLLIETMRPGAHGPNIVRTVYAKR